MMPYLYTKAAQYAAEIFGFDQTGKFFAKSHKHSTASLFLFHNNGTEYLCKIDCHPTASSYSAMLQRFEFAEYLSHNQIRVISPLRSPQGNIIECFRLEECDCMIYAWPKIKGEPLSDKSPKQLKPFYEDWAMLLANIHHVSAQYSKKKSALKQQSADYLFWHQEWQAAMDKIKDARLRDLFSKLKEELDSLPVSNDNFGLIHNDAHPKNLILGNDGLSLIDFDRATRHFFVQDIANAIYSEYSRIEYHSANSADFANLDELFLRPLLNTYLKHYPAARTDLEQIESFLLYRRILMYTIFYEEIKSSAPKVEQDLYAQLIQRQPYLRCKISDYLD